MPLEVRVVSLISISDNSENNLRYIRVLLLASCARKTGLLKQNANILRESKVIKKETFERKSYNLPNTMCFAVCMSRVQKSNISIGFDVSF